MRLTWASETNLYDDQRIITVSVDGQRRIMKPDEALVLKPGQGICLSPCLYHRFQVGRTFVLSWEISMVNGGQHDDYFLELGGRFPAIEEDEPVKWLLCGGYEILR